MADSSFNIGGVEGQIAALNTQITTWQEATKTTYNFKCRWNTTLKIVIINLNTDMSGTGFTISIPDIPAPAENITVACVGANSDFSNLYNGRANLSPERSLTVQIPSSSSKLRGQIVYTY